MPPDTLKASTKVLAEHLHAALNHENLEPTDPLHAAGPATTSILSTRPAAARDFAYKKLHAFPFKDVPACWLRAYEEACLWEVTQRLAQGSATEAGRNHDEGEGDALERWMDRAVELCDWAVIFTGAPRRRELIDEVLGWIARALDNLDGWDSAVRSADAGATAGFDGDATRRRKRRRLESEDDDDHGTCKESWSDSGVFAFSSSNQSRDIISMRPHCAIPRVDCPSLHGFEKHMCESRTPLIITGAIDHWPALQRWRRPGYWRWRTMGGRRLVPVELGKSYTDDGWGQKIMRFKEFMDNYLLRDTDTVVHVESSGPNDPLNNQRRKSHIEGAESSTPPSQNTKMSLAGSDATEKIAHDSQPRTGYLAQHDLLTQIPELRKDIAIPDYCYLDTPQKDHTSDNHVADIEPSAADNHDALSPPASPLLNIWLGPGGTVSPAHTDPHHNILAQIVGSKYVRLFAPSQTNKMYPMRRDDGHTGVDMQNTSRVDVGAFVQLNTSVEGSGEAGDAPTERQEFPEHAKAEFVEGVLQAGECLYIPRGWWHYIRSMEPSCSVSFWWD